jgi:uncharacterized protein YjiS (DUF1127 family)
MIKKILNSKARRCICSLVRNPFLWVYRLYNYLQTWQMHRDTIKHLNRLSNRELSDIGLTRGDIDNLVWMREDFKRRGQGYEANGDK